MPYVIQGGKPVRVSPQEVTVTKQFEEVAVEVIVDLMCPDCGREYKTESGLASHVETKHSDEEE